MPRVLRTSQAELDRVEIALRIARDNPAAADRLLETIDEKCRLLAQMPEMGQERPDLAPDLRSLPDSNHVIFCRPVSDGIQVIRVLHGARDIPALFD
ncbi:MAG TPA: type II toxin-antitoxin system RelE/ParE family toxin [Verrucomicrobiae bacterium]